MNLTRRQLGWGLIILAIAAVLFLPAPLLIWLAAGLVGYILIVSDRVAKPRVAKAKKRKKS